MQKRPSGTFAANGMVVSGHFLASEVGAKILKKGGNAFDAAIATHFSLAVVYPRAGNIGGGGFAVIHTSDGKKTSLDFREKAPGAASRNMYIDEKNAVIPDLSKKGALSVGVPGSVAGMVALHKKYGLLSFEELIQPAIDLAEKGVKLTESESRKLNSFREDFFEVNHRKIYFTPEKKWKRGNKIYHKELAETLKRIRDEGSEGFYSGKTADLIVAAMKNNNGLITYEDLLDYEVVWREPVIFDYYDYTVISMPPPSSGGIALAQLLKGAEQIGLNKYAHNSAQYIHHMVELERRVYADRATYLGDPDFFEIPVEMLLSNDYIEQRNSTVKANIKTSSQDVKAGNVEIIESFETTHFSIVDKWKNAIVVTTTLNGNYGSKLLVKGAGFFLNNEMDDFSIKPGFPNQFGLVGGEANAIEPEKRMLSSMTPTIVEKNGKLKMLLGSPGGSTIITSVFQNIMNAIHYNMTMQQAVNAKRVHSQWLPDKIFAEENVLTETAVDSLKSIGHEIQWQPGIGIMCNILINEQGIFEGAADYLRSPDARAVGY